MGNPNFVPTDPEKVLSKFVPALGVSGWKQTSVSDVAQVTKLPRSTVQRVKSILENAGYLEARFKGVGTGAGGRYAEWRLTVDAPDPATAVTVITDGLRERGWDLTEAMMARIRQEQGTARVYKGRNASAKQRASRVIVAATTDPTARQVVKEVAKQNGHAEPETVHVSGEEPESPMKGMAPARKDDAAALIEAARQYKERAQVVEDSLAALARMGVTVDRSAIQMTEDPALEAVLPLLPYVDSLNATIERLQQRIESTRYSGDAAMLRAELQESRQTVARLVRERGEAQEATKQLMDQWKNRLADADREKRALAQDVTRVTNLLRARETEIENLRRELADKSWPRT